MMQPTLGQVNAIILWPDSIDHAAVSFFSGFGPI